MSFSQFTADDYRLIDKEYKSLMQVASTRCKDKAEVDLVRRAFEFANQSHKNVRRRSGEPYMLHPLAVAKIVVTEIGLGCKSICAALLHDVVEDTAYSVEDVRNLFGDKIATLVDGLTKIKTVLDNEDRKGEAATESLQAENFKRILLTLNDDVRVVLIKLADRLHNCRTIEFMPEHKRDKILSETMFIFIPLAHRLGLYSVKSEMENIWLRYKEPEDYRRISERIKGNIASRDKDIDSFIAPIEQELRQAGYRFTIKKRIKTPYSIWFKMRTKQVPFEQIYDLYAVRIIFEPSDNTTQTERGQAYLIFSTVTHLYRENLSRRRDWISQPKSNGYEALHCTLMSHAGFWVEVQIRSRRMDDIAEKGIAAHWAYKKDGYISENDSEMDKWLAEVQDILLSDDLSALELLDIIHKDLVSSEIVVFTPKGEQRAIRGGATALDFAYQIHTAIGNKAIAAKVNMRLVPLSHTLKAGDQVEIITAESAHPKMEWISFLHTRYARNRVIEYFRRDFDGIARDGKRIFSERIRLMGLQNSKELLRKFQDYSQLHDENELYFRVGLGLLGPEEFKAIIDEKDFSSGERRRFPLREDHAHAIEYRIADCCHPIPGDPVIGFSAGENLVMVHKKSCPIAESLASKYGNRMVVPQWMAVQQEYPIRISLKGIDRMGLLSDISSFISQTLGINMRKLQLSADGELFEGFIELLVRDKKNLERMVEGLSRINGIQNVLRTDI
ncbi:MAG: bifunctional (p)ppGpp synthetase/guanosine-3',5'-bis(diphosphate) 3'-pyrophosphohydrolase [Bacteroidales bacterium]|jgi:guanosine-3',5'-bis(diphosphate) 3'-pyrophosphohydrolase|nr:bifunctional (p)ppGpp synthetase/guanosine-3',5'-bis(diphosphate) 3'-pyrophosphohydrolase [Bacteroidales bacterium]